MPARIADAYCWETDRRETAAAAIARREAGMHDHWFCDGGGAGCGLVLFAKMMRDTGTCFFESGDADRYGEHAEECPHRGGRTEGGGATGGQPPGAAVPPLFVPDRLSLAGGGPPRRNDPPPADRKALAAAAAKAARETVGTLEQVVEAWCRMPPSERDRHPLAIGDRRGTYANGFVWIGAVDDRRLEWADRIVHADCRSSRGNARGFHFLETRFLLGKNGNDGGWSLNVTVRREWYDGANAAADKRYMGDLIDGCRTAGDDVRLFWAGGPGLLRNDFGNDRSDRPDALALRAAPARPKTP